jgi:hypothetical protein
VGRFGLYKRGAHRLSLQGINSRDRSPPMKVSREARLTSPFVLTVSELERVRRYFDASHDLIIKITCDDEIVREFNSTDELAEYENLPSRAINSIGINVFQNDGERVAFIHFGVAPRKNITVKLKGEERDVLALSEFIDARLPAMRPWYGFMVMFDWKGMLISWLVVMGIYSLIMLFLKKLPLAVTDNITAAIVIYVISLVLTLLVVSKLWSAILDKLFPPGVFAIGQGEKRHHDYDIYRQLIVIGIIIEVVGGIITNYMFS